MPLTESPHLHPLRVRVGAFLAFNMGSMGSLDGMWREAHRENALRRPPDQPVTRIQPLPVHVRAITGHAIAYTPTRVLIEWEAWGEWHIRWEPARQVRRV